MTINYDKVQKSINDYGRYILTCIKNEYDRSLSPTQKSLINNLMETQFIVIEKLTNDDIEFFSKQEGIKDPEKYSSEYIPSAHGGRTKGDNKIHIYPFTKSFNNCKDDSEIIKSCIDSIVVHEIFHYFIRPNTEVQNNKINDEFGHFLTEGLVQLYAEKFAIDHRLEIPKSNYNKNVETAKLLITGFPKSYNNNQISNLIFSKSIEELLKISINGNEILKSFKENLIFQEKLQEYIISLGNEINLSVESKELNGIIKHYRKLDDLESIYNSLINNIDEIIKDDQEKKTNYTIKLNTLINSAKTGFKDEIKLHIPVVDGYEKLIDESSQGNRIK